MPFSDGFNISETNNGLIVAFVYTDSYDHITVAASIKADSSMPLAEIQKMSIRRAITVLEQSLNEV